MIKHDSFPKYMAKTVLLGKAAHPDMEMFGWFCDFDVR